MKTAALTCRSLVWRRRRHPQEDAARDVSFGAATPPLNLQYAWVQPWTAADSAGAPPDWVIGVGMIVVGSLVFEINRRLFRDNPEQKVWWKWIPWTFGPLLVALIGLVTLIGSFTQ